MNSFAASLIDGSRHQEQMAQAKRLMAAGRPAKRRVSYFPQIEKASDLATLTGVQVTDDDTFAVYRTAHHLGL